jgi:hypothetical protein
MDMYNVRNSGNARASKSDRTRNEVVTMGEDKNKVYRVREPISLWITEINL